MYHLHTPFWILWKFHNQHIFRLLRSQSMVVQLLIFIRSSFRSIGFTVLLRIALKINVFASQDQAQTNYRMLRCKMSLNNIASLLHLFTYTIENSFAILCPLYAGEFNLLQNFLIIFARSYIFKMNGHPIRSTLGQSIRKCFAIFGKRVRRNSHGSIF